MKLEDFVYKVVARALKILEEEQHYKVPPEIAKKVQERIRDEINTLIEEETKRGR